MSTEFQSMVGSGTQQTRQDNFQKKHGPGIAVNVTNWEDVTAVQEIRASGYDVVAELTRLPSGEINLAGRRVIAVYNNGSNPVYIGQSGIDSNTGYPVATGTEKAFAVAANLDLYAIAGAGNSVNVRIFEIA